MSESKEENKPQSETAEASKQPSTEEVAGGSESPLQEKPLTEKVEQLLAERLTQKKEELEALEKKLDSKYDEIKRFVKETEVEGRSMGPSPEKTEEEKQKEQINKLLTGTGLEI